MFTNALLIATASAIKVREGSWVPDGTEVDLGADSGDESGCQFKVYEKNDMGIREWCETGCVLSGGRMVGPFDTDEGTQKTYCENKDYMTEELFCHPEFTYEDKYGSKRCDETCGPYGGNFSYDGVYRSCDWSEGTDPMGLCPQEWQTPSDDGMTTECDTWCLGSGGHYVWNESWGYNGCEWSNIREEPLFEDD